MSFLYPRTISIHRPAVLAAPGGTNVATLVSAYSGETIASETVVLSGLPASIQYNSGDTRGTAPLPADVQKPGGWNIYLPLSAGVPNGGITEDDVVVDDTIPPRRYQVEAAYSHPMGWKLHCRYLKA